MNDIQIKGFLHQVWIGFDTSLTNMRDTIKAGIEAILIDKGNNIRFDANNQFKVEYPTDKYGNTEKAIVLECEIVHNDDIDDEDIIIYIEDNNNKGEEDTLMLSGLPIEYALNFFRQFYAHTINPFNFSEK